MANYYTLTTPLHPLMATDEEFQKLKRILEEHDEDEDNDAHGMTVYNDEGLLLCHDESAFPEYLPQKALDLIGELLRFHGLPCWEFGWASTCDKARFGSNGGGRFRIMADGSLYFSISVWPEKARIDSDP